MKNIYDDSLVYEFSRTAVGFVYPRFFRQIEIRGVENIPTDEPVIFAANHQNALMDALAVLFYQPKPIVFMARADIFKGKLSCNVLRTLKLTPIFRIRDGFENLSKNETQMQAAVDVLLARKQLCIMPEGNQGDQHKLRALVKGLFRIAYAAEASLEGKAHVKIVPVGIDYSYYQRAGADLVVSYGTPIEVSDFGSLYEENPIFAQNALRDTLAASISELMHDVQSKNHYDEIYRLSCYGTPAYLEYQMEHDAEMNATTLAGLRFEARCALTKMLDTLDEKDPQQILELDALCENLKKLPGSPSEVSEWMDDRRPKALLLLQLVLSLPILPGLLIHIPARLVHRAICKKNKDAQMYATYAFVVGTIVNISMYLILAILLTEVVGSTFLYGVVAFVFLTTLGLVSERSRQSLRLPLRIFSHFFGKKKELIDACKIDFQRLNEAITKLVQMHEKKSC